MNPPPKHFPSEVAREDGFTFRPNRRHFLHLLALAATAPMVSGEKVLAAEISSLPGGGNHAPNLSTAAALAIVSRHKIVTTSPPSTIPTAVSSDGGGRADYQREGARLRGREPVARPRGHAAAQPSGRRVKGQRFTFKTAPGEIITVA